MSLPPELTAGTLDTFGGQIEHLGPDECRIRYRYDRAWCNPRGTLQGGVLTVFLDDAMSYAVLGARGQAATFSTISMTVDFLAPVAAGDLVAVGRLTRDGRRVLFLEGRIETDAGEVAARATGTALALR